MRFERFKISCFSYCVPESNKLWVRSEKPRLIPQIHKNYWWRKLGLFSVLGELHLHKFCSVRFYHLHKLQFVESHLWVWLQNGFILALSPWQEFTKSRTFLRKSFFAIKVLFQDLAEILTRILLEFLIIVKSMVNLTIAWN